MQESDLRPRDVLTAKDTRARDLLADVPRLDGVREMIARQQEPVAVRGDTLRPIRHDRHALGGQILRVCTEFDALVQEANSFVGDPQERLAMYHEAERILVEDVGGIFLDHRIQGDLFQPYVAGDCFRPNAQGVSAWQWGNDWCWGAIYITDEVANYDTYRGD